MQEFKAKIMDAQSQLQRELQRARQETKDAIDARDQHIEEMSELSENVELITLDKEMAEEKADTLQVELTAAKERCEELQLDLEILKNEMQNKSSSKFPNLPFFQTVLMNLHWFFRSHHYLFCSYYNGRFGWHSTQRLRHVFVRI